ncbi:MAG TPA: hypothetical protein PKV23_06630 [Aestuariivirga sp.]|mgnify:FL=1|nr:hypothetical protein [Aestuariivirga sp.]
MMRKLLTAVLFVLLSLSVAPAQSNVPASTSQDEVLMIQKKKKLATLKAAE